MQIIGTIMVREKTRRTAYRLPFPGVNDPKHVSVLHTRITEKANHLDILMHNHV